MGMVRIGCEVCGEASGKMSWQRSQDMEGVYFQKWKSDHAKRTGHLKFKSYAWED